MMIRSRKVSAENAEEFAVMAAKMQTGHTAKELAEAFGKPTGSSAFRRSRMDDGADRSKQNIHGKTASRTGSTIGVRGRIFLLLFCYPLTVSSAFLFQAENRLADKEQRG